TPPAAPISGSLPDSIRGARDDLSLAMGGLLAGTTGLVLGAYAGAALEQSTGCAGDWCGLGGGLVGAALGSTLMVPIGVHLANDQRGNLGQSVAASGFALAAGLGFS